MVNLLTLFVLLCSVISLQTHRRARSSDQCNCFVKSPFDYCAAAGYNDTFEFPEGLTAAQLQAEAADIREIVHQKMNCSQNTLAVAMTCSYFVPECSKGKRVYPCKRVCNEFLKQCETDIPEFFSAFFMAYCHDLPDETASSGKCHEPPNFTTNDSVPGPLDRGCQEIIIPACKNLKVSNYTFISFELQKKLYKFTYKKEYTAGNVETDFPPMYQKVFQEYPKCQDNLKKLICGEFVQPCFPDEPEGVGSYTICQSVCDEIDRDCPDFFRNNYPGAQYCDLAGNETSSHGFCRRKEWPPPFAWAHYALVSEEATTESTKSPKTKRPKVWIIVVGVVVPLVVVALVLGGAIWWKWRCAPVLSRYTIRPDDIASTHGSGTIYAI